VGQGVCVFARVQVVFAGGRLQPGTTKLEEDCEHQPFNVLATDGSRAEVIKHIHYIQKVIRRRPFMIKSLEPVLKRNVQCLVSAVYLPRCASLRKQLLQDKGRWSSNTLT